MQSGVPGGLGDPTAPSGPALEERGLCWKPAGKEKDVPPSQEAQQSPGVPGDCEEPLHPTTRHRLNNTISNAAPKSSAQAHGRHPARLSPRGPRALLPLHSQQPPPSPSSRHSSSSQGYYWAKSEGKTRGALATRPASAVALGRLAHAKVKPTGLARNWAEPSSSSPLPKTATRFQQQVPTSAAAATATFCLMSPPMCGRCCASTLPAPAAGSGPDLAGKEAQRCCFFPPCYFVLSWLGSHHSPSALRKGNTLNRDCS